MRALTFKGFLKSYVNELSLHHTNSIYRLVEEAATNNSRLKEPLYLYAAFHHHTSTLLMASKSTPLYQEYEEMHRSFDNEALLTALQSGNACLSIQYHKVWNSYNSIRTMPERDRRVKSLMRTRILRLQREKQISTYKLCKELNLDNSNVNAWLKHDDANRVSLETARGALHFVETSGIAN